ncbi:heparinase II/III family protein [Chitinophaga nivalis]|uniref:Heparinase II/III family protein n=1 Tax=Chitinophaga nivalis TaxID=2991709 RepID=A0ABT3INU5_9BACT|nr:alginate lyase family protein [Chitinophaga nivalis]MCW3464669.1 heparinase II/III family protein [Chitinophaga nivalis]MCW3485640.1 heparinase II/III family protein [Chitinophaga nivalis]
MSSLNTMMKGIKVARNMGWRYMAFRSVHELNKRTGRLKKRFPQAPPFQRYLSLRTWKEQPARFFFQRKEDITVPRHPSDALAARFNQIKAGQLSFFNGATFSVGKENNWMKNPDTGFEYEGKRHWTEINDYSREAGDIKFVWEKARFAYLYDIIRYDYHFKEDCAEMVFADILSWIKANAVNCGPHYKCSQEISLRVLNWTFALYYYRDSPVLTEDVFDHIQYAIYWQLHHVYHNINFSRIAVRNNHAITETLALYLGGLLYPSLPDAATWKAAGKRWFEQEINYQVYEDGTFLQFSMNYHRVVIQLLTWALRLASLNNETFVPGVKEKAAKSLRFLRVCMNDSNGWLPNYGANDGALFFRLSDQHYRDYRPQLQALAVLLDMEAEFPETYEDVYWYGKKQTATLAPVLEKGKSLYEFPAGGYYVCREPDTLTFLRCGSHHDRPSQADNLHLDVWYKGENVLMDAGSYKYNTDEQTLRYFMGTASHNTVMLEDYDQMEKGPRFIWYNWTMSSRAKLYETADEIIWEGTISAFQHVAPDITHYRQVRKKKGEPVWVVRDYLQHKPFGRMIQQRWHTCVPEKFRWKTVDREGILLHAQKQHGMYSSLYGVKEVQEEIIFTTTADSITTEISLI